MIELGKEVKKLNQDPYILEKIRIENEDKKWNNTYFSRGKWREKKLPYTKLLKNA